VVVVPSETRTWRQHGFSVAHIEHRMCPNGGGTVSKVHTFIVVAIAFIVCPSVAAAQQNVPPAGQRAEGQVETTVRRFGGGVQGGIALDPEIINFGAHATFGPLFRSNLQLRPGVEFGLGEVTTLFGINADVLYTIPGFSSETRLLPYVGAGPNFSLSHRGFETADGAKVDLNGNPVGDQSRFDFSDTDFTGGMNFIVGMRRQRGMFFEMKATAWGVSNVRLLAGYNF
jgi:hypothetical protein